MEYEDKYIVIKVARPLSVAVGWRKHVIDYFVNVHLPQPVNQQRHIVDSLRRHGRAGHRYLQS